MQQTTRSTKRILLGWTTTPNFAGDYYRRLTTYGKESRPGLGNLTKTHRVCQSPVRLTKSGLALVREVIVG
jgi:hypothetical protein